MDAAFELQLAVSATAFDQRDDFLEAADSCGIRRQDFNAPPLRFRESRIHAEDIRDKQSSLVAAGACANFQNDVSFVIGVLGQQQHFQIGVALVEPIFEGGKLFLSHRLEVGIGFIPHHRLRFLDATLEIRILAKLRNELAELAVSLREFLVLLAVGNGLRIGQLAVEFFVPSFGCAKPFDENVRERHCYTVNASSSARIAISSCVSSGSFVVIF